MSHDPPRLIDDPATPAPLRALLAGAREDGLDPVRVARVLETVERAGAAPLSPGHGWVAKGALVLGTGAVVLAVWFGAGPKDPIVPDPARVVAPPLREVEPEGAVETAPVSEPVAEPVSAPEEVTEPVVVPEKRPNTLRTAIHHVDAEGRLLLAARRALPDHPADALEQTERHRREFANGALAQERELIAIQALVALGRHADAKTRAERFHQWFPSSPHGTAVDEVIRESTGGAPATAGSGR